MSRELAPARPTKAVLLLLALGVVVVAGLLVQPYRAQQASRYALTAALVDHGTVVLDRYEDVLGVDRASYNGHLYSDKAPGQPVLAAPFYALGRLVGVEDASVLRIDENLGLWWVTLWSAVLPAIAIVWMTYSRGTELGIRRSLPASIVIFLGTLLLPFSSLLFGHVLAAALLYGAYLLLVRDPSPSRYLVGGLIAGVAVTVEYTAALGVVVLAVLAVWRLRRRSWAFFVGGVIPAACLAFYNWVAFDNPFVLSYQHTAFSNVAESSRSLLGMFSSATVDNAARLFLDGRGLLVATPVVLLAVGGAIWRLRKGTQVDAVLALAMFGVFLLLPLFWGNPWGGDSPGPRYLVPALPFLAIPLGWVWERLPRLTFVAASVSVITMLAATFTDPLIDRFTAGGLGIWLDKLANGDVADTLFTMAWGPRGWIVHMVLLACVISGGLMIWRRGRLDIREVPR